MVRPVFTLGRVKGIWGEVVPSTQLERTWERALRDRREQDEVKHVHCVITNRAMAGRGMGTQWGETIPKSLAINNTFLFNVFIVFNHNQYLTYELWPIVLFNYKTHFINKSRNFINWHLAMWYINFIFFTLIACSNSFFWAKMPILLPWKSRVLTRAEFEFAQRVALETSNKSLAGTPGPVQ